jgi:glycosyltransferase involved in cell wall biosynthesis
MRPNPFLNHMPNDRLRQQIKTVLQPLDGHVIASGAPGPDFSIITPSYEQLDWLRLCIASVQDQTDDRPEAIRIEHLVEDGGSAGIGKMAEQAATLWTADRSCYALRINSANDRGMYDAINRGLLRARGQILAWLNCDEQYLPGTLTKVGAFFADNPEVDVLFGDALLVGESGDILSYRRAVLPGRLHTQVAHLNTLSCAMFFRRRLIERGFLLDENSKAVADAKWVADLLDAKIPMAVLHQPLSVFVLTYTNLGQTELARQEGLAWRNQASWLARAMTHPLILRHRIAKLLSGAYGRRSLRTAYYTRSSPETRLEMSSHSVPFAWPEMSGPIAPPEEQSSLPPFGTDYVSSSPESARHQKSRSDKLKTPAWSTLFHGSCGNVTEHTFTILSRQGHDFLFLPNRYHAALHTLQLYAAQTLPARAAKVLVQGMLGLGLSRTLPQCSFRVSDSTPFANFLQSCVPRADLGTFGVIVGNPKAPGTRDVILLFNNTKEPLCVVKVGISAEARERVRQEAEFSRVHRDRFIDVPVSLGFADTEDYAALILPFVAGKPPSISDHRGIAKLLGSWLVSNQHVPLASVPLWQALTRTDAHLRRILGLAHDHNIAPALFHGDFTPWNIRVTPAASWVALDWERGQYPGIPGWDWFHYIVQTSILVRNESAEGTLRRLQKLFASDLFRHYAQAANITAITFPLFIGYLVHAVQLQQTEGTAQLHRLLEVASRSQTLLTTSP